MKAENALSEEIEAAARILRAGGTVAFPTETVYGLGADAANPLAVQKIFAIKGRPVDHPVIVHIAAATHLSAWAATIPDDAWRLAEAFWPGPLTIILARNRRVPLVTTGGQDTVGLRVPDHPVAMALLAAFDGGIAAPSANLFGHVSPTTAQHVRDELGARVDIILDGGSCRVGVESSIVDLTYHEPILLRPGGVAVEALEAVLGQRCHIGDPRKAAVRAPGMLASHYAPATPLEMCASDALLARSEALLSAGYRLAILPWRIYAGSFRSSVSVFQMPHEAHAYARVLYACLRAIDQGNFDRLLVETPPFAGQWAAIHDRLGRAANRHLAAHGERGGGL